MYVRSFGSLETALSTAKAKGPRLPSTWGPLPYSVVVKNYGRFWVLNSIRHLVFRGPRRAP